MPWASGNRGENSSYGYIFNFSISRPFTPENIIICCIGIKIRQGTNNYTRRIGHHKGIRIDAVIYANAISDKMEAVAVFMVCLKYCIGAIRSSTGYLNIVCGGCYCLNVCVFRINVEIIGWKGAQYPAGKEYATKS